MKHRITLLFLLLSLGLSAWPLYHSHAVSGKTGAGQQVGEPFRVPAIAAGGAHSLALKSDGTVVAWGDNSAGQRSVPSGLSGVTALAAGGFHSLALSVVNNTPPTITAASVTRTAGSPTSNAQIATVSDAEDAKNTLSVTATPVSGSGVTRSGLSVDTSGNVTADIAASCTATTSTFTLQVTDSGSLSATASLTVTVNANQPPTLSYPANPGTSYGTGITVNPLTGPSDDLGVTSVVLQSITPSNPGGITVNSSGVVTVANTVPAGSYTVTIRANAECGNRDASFTLGIVKATPVITWNNPADITYGTALSATQLNATANVSGSNFTYTPASGTVLNAGNGQTLSVTFTPTDTNNYNSASKTVQLNVLKAPLLVTVNNAFRNQGVANPPLSGSVTGQKNGDVITASYSATAMTGSAPGNYPITATLNDPGNRLSNYQVTNTPGTLKVFNSCGITPVPFFATQGAVGGYWLYYQPLFTGTLPGIYTFSLFAGTLPPGLAIVNNLGQYVLQGTPTPRGVFTFTLLAKNTGNSCEAIHTYTITIQ